jgi:flavin reductase (DIM6/NTAB) family NADH-FMN oxidoreductase RutF
MELTLSEAGRTIGRRHGVRPSKPDQAGPQRPEDGPAMTHSPISEPASDADPAIDQRTFWRAIGNRASGSTVVTARSADGPAGFLGLSATHVCADPPLMLVSVDRRTSALQTMLAARHFALNFLPCEAAAVADMFGGKAPQKGAERFETGRWGTLKTGAPILLDAVGAIDCRLEETIERHGVVIAIGRVVAVMDGGDKAPLIHFRGAYVP